ncbi:calcium-binding and coiled-coil domain-containing protein 1-like, partial [Mustelus asterias]
MDGPKVATPSHSEVVFHNVTSSYLPGTPVECHYSLANRSTRTANDWIGLFKVGWRSVREYHTFVWSPSPQGQTGRSPLNCCVRFEASYLPPPGASLYQFSYINGNGTLRGSSNPFTFSSPEPQDELVILEGPDSNPDMVLVVTKSSLLETQLAESERTRGDLTKRQKETEMEVRELEGRVRELAASGERSRHEQTQLLERCKTLTEEERKAREECQVLRRRLMDSTARMQELEGQVKTIAHTLLERENTLDRVRDRVTKMTVEQKEHSRQAVEDSEERQLFEAQIDSLKREGWNLRATLADRDVEVTSLKTEVQRLQQQVATASKNKQKYDTLSEQLLSSRQEVALMGEEMSRAASVRDRAVSELQHSRLQAAELEVKLADVSGRWEESEERWREERSAQRQKSEAEKEKVLRLSAELLRWKASAQERESETECLRQELGRERDHNRVRITKLPMSSATTLS